MTTNEHEDSQSVMIEWTTPDHLSINYFNVYITNNDRQQLLGHTTGCKYVIENSIVDKYEKPIKVIVQPVLKIGLIVPTKQCKSVIISN